MVIGGHADGFLQIAGVIFRDGDGFEGLAEYFTAGCRVGLHDGKLFIRELARFIEDRIRHDDLADVVERCGADDVFTVFVGQDIRVTAVCLELVGNDLCVGGGLFDVVAGQLVTAFDEVGENVDQTVLHFLQLLGFLSGILDIIHGVVAHLGQGFVEVLDLIAGFNPQVVDLFDAFLAFGLSVESESAGRNRHRVDRVDDDVIGEPEAGRKKYDEEPDEKGNDAGEEDLLLKPQLVHGNVDARIALTYSALVLDRNVDRQEPAIGVVRNDRGYVFAFEEFGDQSLKGFVKRNDLTRICAGKIGRVDIEDDVAAVLQNPVDIDVLQFFAAVQHISECLFNILVAGGILTFQDVHVDIFRDYGVAHDGA